MGEIRDARADHLVTQLVDVVDSVVLLVPASYCMRGNKELGWVVDERFETAAGAKICVG